MNKNSRADDKQFGVAQPWQIGAYIVKESISRVATDAHQHQLNWKNG